MNVICVDDEKIQLKSMVKVCFQIKVFTSIKEFAWAQDALDYFKENCTSVDIAFIDIDMPVMNGIILAKEIKTLSPNTVVVFTTGYSEFAFEAYQINAFGYLLKPIRKEDVENVLENIESLKKISCLERKVCVRTFGNFEVFVDGKPISFARSQSREIFAYLIDKMGTGCTRAELATIFWEDGLYDRNRQNTLNSYIVGLKKSLAENGIGQILLSVNGRLMIDIDKINCDVYKFLNGEIGAVNSFRGEYMVEYEWAEFTTATLIEKLNGLQHYSEDNKETFYR